MNTRVRYFVHPPGHQEFVASLPEEARRYIVSLHESDAVFVFPDGAYGIAREVHRRAREAGANQTYQFEVQWKDEYLDEDRLFPMFAKDQPGARLDPETIREVRPCPRCGFKLRTLPREMATRPRLELDAPPELPLFSPETGVGTVIADAFAERLTQEGLLRGARLIPLDAGGDGYSLLTSTVAVGMPVSIAGGEVCAACGRARGHTGTLYPLYRRPPTPTDVAWSGEGGELVPRVSGRLGRRIVELIGPYPNVNFFAAGFHPDHVDDARPPRLFDEPSAS